jgi:hypothetical protein
MREETAGSPRSLATHNWKGDMKNTFEPMNTGWLENNNPPMFLAGLQPIQHQRFLEVDSMERR